MYGKAESGRVIGRCLFVLADSGALLTYRRFAHNAKDGFEEEVNRFAEQLAKAMCTTPATDGHVSNLVAKEWYDDGAIPNESLYDLQNPDGLVRTILRTEDVSRILPKLLAVFASQAALKGMLGVVLSLDDFQQRKEIIEPLIEMFGFDATVPWAERFRLAILAHQAGKKTKAQEIVGRLRLNSLPRRLKRLGCRWDAAFRGIGSCREVFNLLSECNPSIALRAIRTTRPWNVRLDAEETNPDRRVAIARCHELLGKKFTT